MTRAPEREIYINDLYRTEAPCQSPVGPGSVNSDLLYFTRSHGIGDTPQKAGHHSADASQ